MSSRAESSSVARPIGLVASETWCKSTGRFAASSSAYGQGNSGGSHATPQRPLMVSWVTRRGSRFGSLWRAQGRHYCKAESCSAVEGLGGFGQCVKRGVEAVLAAPVGFVVGFGGHEPDQLLQVVCTGQQGSAVGVGAHAKHQPLTVGVEQHQLA